MHRCLLPQLQWPPTRLIEQYFATQVDVRELLAREGPVHAAHVYFDHLADEQGVVSSHMRGNQMAIERSQGVPQ